MKRSVITLLLALCASFVSHAQDTPVIITDMFYGQSTDPWNGEVTISWPAFEAAGHTQVPAGSRKVTVSAGVLLIDFLLPNQGAHPQFLYKAVWRSTSGGDRGTTWTDPGWLVTPTSTKLEDVRPISGLTTGRGLTYVGVYAGRPTSPRDGDLAEFTDASTAGQCPGGGGTERTLCSWHATDSAWVAVSGTGSGSGGGGGSGIDGNATWAEIEAGTAGSGSVVPSMTWAQIESQ